MISNFINNFRVGIYLDARHKDYNKLDNDMLQCNEVLPIINSLKNTICN